MSNQELLVKLKENPSESINIETKDIETEVIEIGKNEENKKVIIRKVIDIEIKTKITIYKYYPDSKGKYNIKKECKNTRTRVAKYPKKFNESLLYL